jgi:predicted RNase H-like nuclease (RuvC/YqgF family)
MFRRCLKMLKPLLKMLKRRLKTLKRRLKMLKRHLKVLKRQISTFKRQISMLKPKISIFKRRFSTLNRRFSALIFDLKIIKSVSEMKSKNFVCVQYISFRPFKNKTPSKKHRTARKSILSLREIIPLTRKNTVQQAVRRRWQWLYSSAGRKHR